MPPEYYPVLKRFGEGVSPETFQAALLSRPLDGSDPPSAGALLAFIRRALQLLGYQTQEDGKELYGTHSPRRGAAQAFCAAGWSLEQIKFFGRWRSSCIGRYLFPRSAFGDDFSASMLVPAHRLLLAASARAFRRVLRLKRLLTSPSLGILGLQSENQEKRFWQASPGRSSRLHLLRWPNF